MYICKDCGQVVDELPTYTEREECWGHYEEFEYVDNCYCGGEWSEAVQCCCCGEYFDLDRKELSKEVEKDFYSIDEEYIEEFFEPDEIDADVCGFCEECIHKKIKEYKEWLLKKGSVKNEK